MKKFLAFLIVLFILQTDSVYAQYLPSKGVPTVSNIVLNKQVKNPSNGQFVENLNANDYKFLAGQEISFKLEIRNTGQTDLNNVQVKDRLPDQLNFVSGPGKFDQSSRTLNFTIDKLSPGESKTFEIKAKVNDPLTMTTCLTNYAEVRVNELFAQDNAVFCIESKILGTTTTELPKTGPTENMLMLLGSTGFLILGIYLFRTAKGETLR